MKRLFFLSLLCLWSVAAIAGGIATAKDLTAFAAACNAGQSIERWQNAEGAVCLEADIDMAKEKKFAGIAQFGGVFDGCGHALLNWRAQHGLFGEVLAGGVVRNLRIDASCSMRAQNKSAEYSAGFVADLNSGIIENCENHGSISHRSNYTDCDVSIGGIVGTNRFAVLRCRNFGAIESVAASTVQKSELSLHLGGVVGGNALKTERCPVVAWCENTGAITCSGDFPVYNVGGVVGRGAKVPTKYAINRGNITVATSEGTPATEKLSTQARVGGVVGFTKGDVMCCDNFGEVRTSGTHSPNVGGVVAMPHAAVVIGDCMNYGAVKVSNEAAGYVGGIVGGVNRPMRIRACINRGEVLYDGISPSRRTSVGGIAGSVSVKRDATAGTYVRNCLNCGRVRSEAAANRYANHDRAIHTGGVVGWLSGSEQAKVMMRDCANRGEVSAAGGRCGKMCGACQTAEVGGEYVDDYAESAEPMSDGSNIFGRVFDTDGMPIAGIKVSDGEQCTTTDGYGCYAMKSDLSAAKFVYLSVPSGYEMPVRNGQPQFFRRIARHERAVMADFRLAPRTAATDDYTMIMVADPQMRPYGVDGSAEAYRDAVAPDMEALRKTLSEPCYAIDLGDLVYNFMTAYDDYIDISATFGAPMFNVMGNHDYDQTTLFDSSLGTMYFETYIGPLNYSFDIGRIHYIVLSDIVYNRPSAQSHYRSGLEERAMRWLENDLRDVPKERTIVVCEHSQLFKKVNTYSTKNLNYARYAELLGSYKRVYSWAGHNHENYLYNYAGKGKGLDNVSSILVSRSTGALRLNKYLNHDGTPQGYMVAQVRGDSLSWYYKSVGRERDYQMRLYAPARTDGRSVVANIWNYGDGWSRAEWWENGAKVADMEQFSATDYDYEALYANVTNKTTRKYCAPVKSRNMFRVVPSADARSGEVRVTDNFGNRYTAKIEW